MFNRPVDVLCSPVLLAQGLYTLLSVSGRLAEPLGGRKGIVGHAKSKPLRILVTGDSAAAGVGVDQQTDALAGQIVHHLQDSFYCEWELHAKSGFTSSDGYHPSAAGYRIWAATVAEIVKNMHRKQLSIVI